MLSQQFILADGGFKSFVTKTTNDWVSSLNIDGQVWKIFNLYGDAGWYKNKGSKPNFIWDSGVKIRIIRDFLEIYLPVYSSLGFEPTFNDYFQRIRFTFSFNINSVSNSFRRGLY